MSELALADKGAKEQKHTALKIHPSRFVYDASTMRKLCAITPTAGTPFDALLQPSYWANVAERLRPFDRIEVLAEDGSYFAILLVRAASRLSAKVAVLEKYDLDAVDDTSAESAFFVAWRGPHQKHAVIRAADKLAVQTGFDTKEAAMTWLANNLRSLTVS